MTSGGVVEPPLDAPSDLRSREVRLALARTIKRFQRDDVPSLAAAVAFKIFLALFPAILAAAAIYGLVSTPTDVFESFLSLSRFLPQGAADLMARNLGTMTRAETGTAGLVALLGVFAGLFVATGAAATLIRALNRINDVHQPRSFLTQRIVALAITVALFLALGSLAVLIVAGGTLQNLLLPDRLQVPVVTVPLTIARYALALLVLVALFGFVYSVGPNRVPPRWRWLSPGAIVGVLGWLVVAGAFRIYTITIGAQIYDEGSYGAIAGVIVFLLWLQLSMLAMLTGAELNAELERLRADRHTARERALHPSDVSSPMLSSEPVELSAPGQRPLIRRALTRWSALASRSRR